MNLITWLRRFSIRSRLITCMVLVVGIGSIVGSGTVSNHDRSVGSCCLAEQRMIEIIDSGAAITPFMKVGDTVRIEMKDAAGLSIFGAIAQTVVKHG